MAIFSNRPDIQPFSKSGIRLDIQKSNLIFNQILDQILDIKKLDYPISSQQDIRFIFTCHLGCRLGLLSPHGAI
jgi:hypothetical protein